MVITNKHISRRAVLRGMGATVAMPFLEAMVPARKAWGDVPSVPTRLVCIEMVHGAAGSTKYGLEKNLWAPAADGSEFDLAPTALSSLEPFRSHLTIVSNTDVRQAEAFTLPEIGGDHFRSSAVFLTQCHPKQTEGSDVRAGISLEQLYANRFGQDTPVPSMQLSIESVDQAGGCTYGYSCVYTDTISWASENDPLPMVRNPRVVFDQLFGAGATPEERAARRRTDSSILDWISDEVARVNKELGPSDRRRLSDYLESVREIERRIQKIEERNQSGEPRELPGAPIGVPDSFDEHVKLMFDLMAAAFTSDTTRVFSFKMGRDGSGRVYPESGVTTGFHNSSHHREQPKRIEEFFAINRYHVSTIPYLLGRLEETIEGDSNLLEKSLVLYGSPMGNPNVHNHKRCPLFLAGHANGQFKGNLHLKAADETPMANAMLTLLRRLGLEELESFGDSTGEMAL
ncbi:MAG TPA: DUF1552 domain-containing protein [Vicinamibacteria bacterium]|nr:DUF1552 domain-containing protein [Vicinamibacteria bacterium]